MGHIPEEQAEVVRVIDWRAEYEALRVVVEALVGAVDEMEAEIIRLREERGSK